MMPTISSRIVVTSETGPTTLQQWRIKGSELTVIIDEVTFAVSVQHYGRVWNFDPAGTDFLTTTGGLRARPAVPDASLAKFTKWQTGSAAGIQCDLMWDNASDDSLPLHLSLRVWIDATTSEVGFEVIPATTGDACIASIAWPTPIRPCLQPATSSAVIPAMQGVLLPGDWPKQVNLDLGHLTYTRTLYMPWWGEIRDGAGFIAIIDTPYDAALNFSHPAGGPTRCGVQWVDSQGSLSYPRRVLFRFFEAATHVTLAKAYRAYLSSRGRLVTLLEKVARSPRVGALIGAPVVHEGIWYPAQPTSKMYKPDDQKANDGFVQSFDTLGERLDQLHRDGITNAYVHVDGWGNRGYDNLHPSPLPPSERAGGWDGMIRLADKCSSHGYTLALHDQYRDYYEDGTDFNADHAILNADNTRPSDDTWLGGKQLFLCATQALGYVRRNYREITDKGVQIGGVYLDVFAIAGLDQCFHPGHRMTRKECAEHRADCFGHIRSLGLIISSEEPADHAVADLDLVHHAPYATYPNLGGGDATGIPVPLFSLVYHDCLLVPWEMKDNGGWGTPNGDAGWLHALLNGGMPYLDMKGDGEHRQKVQLVSDLHRQVAVSEMTSHRLVDPAGRVQVSEFADGTRVEVNFDTRQFAVSRHNADATSPPEQQCRA